MLERRVGGERDLVGGVDRLPRVGRSPLRAHEAFTPEHEDAIGEAPARTPLEVGDHGIGIVETVRGRVREREPAADRHHRTVFGDAGVSLGEDVDRVVDVAQLQQAQSDRGGAVGEPQLSAVVVVWSARATAVPPAPPRAGPAGDRPATSMTSGNVRIPSSGMSREIAR